VVVCALCNAPSKVAQEVKLLLLLLLLLLEVTVQALHMNVVKKPLQSLEAFSYKQSMTVPV